MSSVNSTKQSGGVRFQRALQLLGVMFGVLLLCTPSFSQGVFGRILGTVTDTSGGAVSGATVTILDTERGTSRVLTTDDAGAYNAPSLSAGNYTVRAEAKGFKKLERPNVVVEVGHEVRIDLTVQPGEQNQTVTVTESVPLVETTNATQGGTLENADIIDLPLNGRDFQNLLGLRPGVMLQPGGGPWTQSTNGVRPDESVWLVEGVINANFFDARPVINMPSPFTDGATILPVDAIQEFNLMENPKAEYGWKAGAIVNVGVKSGTNTFHGDAYAFGRYQNWDARNYFNVAPTNGTCGLNGGSALSLCDQTPAQLKQFGGVAGGKIKKDKLFYFGGYEGLRSFIGFVGGLGSPAPSSLANINGNGPLGDPTHSMVDAIQALQAANIPRSGVSETLAGCTEPTTKTAACTGGVMPNIGTSNTFLSTFPTANTSDNGVGKLDYHLNDKNTINGMFFYGHYNAIGEDHPFGQQSSTDSSPIRTTSITASWVYTPSSNVVNEMRFGHDRITFNFINVDVGVNPTTYGFTPTGITNKEAGGAPSVTISPFGLGGTPVIGTAFNRPQYFTPNPYSDFQDSVSLLKGKHSVKIGGEYAHLEANAKVYNNGRGRLDFPSVQGFFQGIPSGTLLTGNPQSKLTAGNFAGYIQDDWRISPRVIINLGVRYMYLTPLKDANNLLGNFDPASPTGMVQQGQNGNSTIWRPDTHDFEPRAGFAWDMKGNGTTVLRVGVGLIHETWNLETFEGQFIMQNDGSTSPSATPTGASISCGITAKVSSITCPSSGGGSITLGSAGFAPSKLCWDPAVPTACGAAGQATIFPSGAAGPKCGDGVSGAASPCDLMSVDPNLKLPYVVNYNIGVTHAITPNLSLEVEFVGNHGYRLLNFADINQAPLGAAYCLNAPLTAAQAADACKVGGTGSPVQEARPFFTKFPYLGFINHISNRSYSDYNSLQVALTKRMSHGLAFNVGYTYGHGLDNGSLNRFGLNPQDSTNLRADYASSDFDVRHRLTATVTYNIPGRKGFGQMLEGWQINTIGTYATAQPWQVFDNAGPDNFSGTNEFADRWNISGNPADFPSGLASIPNCTGFNGTLTGNTPSAANGGTITGNVTCNFTTIYGATNLSNAAATAAINGCQTHAVSGGTLATGGCYASANGVSFITPQALGTFGNMGRNILRDSGFKNIDFSLFKNWTFKERYGIQARWEVFNIVNKPIAANPSGASSAVNTNNQLGPGNVFGASLLTPDFGAGNPLIGSGSQRVMQVGLKLTF